MKTRKLKMGVFAHNVFMTLARQILGILIGLGYTIVVARVLGPNGYGVFALVLFFPTLLITLSNLGVAPATVFFISRNDFPVGEVVKSNLLIGILLFTLAVIVGVFLIIFWGNSLFHGVSLKLLALGLLIIPGSLLLGFITAIFQGLQNFRRFNIMSILPQLIIFVLSALGIICFGGSIKLLIWANIIGHVISIGVCFWWLREFLASNYGVNLFYLMSCLRYGLKAHLSNILAFLNYRIDILLLVFFLSPSAVGIYTASVQVAERLWVLSQSFSTVLLPMISELKEDESTRHKLTPFIARWVLFLTFLFSLAIAFLSPLIVDILFGNAYINAVGALCILLPGIVLGALSRILSNDIAGRGRPEINMYIALITVAVNIIANIVLIPRMGINGAALATTLSYSFNTVLKIIAYSMVSGLKWYKIFFH